MKRVIRVASHGDAFAMFRLPVYMYLERLPITKTGITIGAHFIWN